MTAKLTEWKIKSARRLNFFFKIFSNVFFFLNLLLILFCDKIFQPDNFESLAALLYLYIFMFPLISIFKDNDFFCMLSHSVWNFRHLKKPVAIIYLLTSIYINKSMLIHHKTSLEELQLINSNLSWTIKNPKRDLTW